MAITLANLLVKVRADTATLSQDLGKIGNKAKNTAKKIGSMEISLTRLVAVGAGLGFVGKQIFEIGAAVEETGSKFNTVFGESADSVQGFIDQFGVMAGLSDQAAQDVLATTGAIAQGMGFAQEASAQFATEIVRLAGDLSSFNNIPIEETSLAIQAALTGEREQLKRMGIVVREVDVQQQAFANTGKTVAATLTNQEKATATLQLITERAGFAVGDLARTQDSAANQARALGAELKNLRDNIAVSLLPALAAGVTGLNAFIKGFQIMGAEAAVAVAKIELAFAKLGEEGGIKGKVTGILGLGEGAGLFDPLGLDLFSRAIGADLGKSVTEAEANLARMETAANAVTLDIVGLTESLTGPGGLTGALGGDGMAGSVTAIKAAFDALDVTLVKTGDTFKSFKEGLERMKLPTKAAVKGFKSFKDELNSATQAMKNLKAESAGFGGILSRLASIAGVFSLGPLGGLLGKGSSLFGAFSGLFGGGGGLAGDLKKKFAGGRADGGPIARGQFAVVGERGPELVSGPAMVTPMGGGGDITLNIQLVTESGERTADNITIRQKRKENLGQVIRVPVPVGVVG